jgi:hypothetical protein
MEEPSPRSSRRAIAAVLGAGIVIAGVGFLLGRTTAEPARPKAPPAVAIPSPAPTSEPILKGQLGRADIIALAASAADALAAGRQPKPAVAQAEGRRFALRLPFGCTGPAGENSNAAMRWRYDAESQTLRIHVAPVVWTAAEWWASGEAAGVEAVEGFWISHPWTSSEACPAPPGGPVAVSTAPVTLPGQTLAVGQVFFGEAAHGSRRHGDAYEAAIRIPQTEFDASDGFRLLITGRIAGNRATGPVTCRQPAGPEQRPICLVSVVIDEVAIENPATGETLSTWSLGRRNTPQT